MKNLRLGQITVIFMGLLLIFSGCGVTVRVDDPVGAARDARDATTADVREFHEVVPPFPESRREIDDKIGYEEWFHFVDEETVKPIDGVIRRQQYFIPEGRSPLEIIRYYQSKLQEQGAEIFFHSRDPESLRFNGERITHYFGQQKQNRTPQGNLILDRMHEFLSAKINIDGDDIYVVVAIRASDGIWSGRYEVVTVVD